MSTEIATITGTYHKKANPDFSVVKDEAELHLTRFFNGKKDGTNIQVTVRQNGNNFGETSYIHLTKEQCKELAVILNECFDYDKYPSE